MWADGHRAGLRPGRRQRRVHRRRQRRVEHDLLRARSSVSRSTTSRTTRASGTCTIAATTSRPGTWRPIGLVGLAVRDAELVEYAITQPLWIAAPDRRTTCATTACSGSGRSAITSSCVNALAAVHGGHAALRRGPVPACTSRPIAGRTRIAHYVTDTSDDAQVAADDVRVAVLPGVSRLELHPALGDSDRGPLRGGLDDSWSAWNRYRDPHLAWLLRATCPWDPGRRPRTRGVPALLSLPLPLRRPCV